MKKQIPLFFTIDHGYVPYLATAITSIIENSSKEYDYKIHILHEKLTKEDISKISSLQRDGFEITFKQIKEGMELITEDNKYRCDYFTLTIFFRIFIADLFPEYNKGLYIDSDVVVSGDISELYNIELGSNIIGACTDNSIQRIPPLTDYLEQAIGVPKLEYINSGVLLMDLKKMREKEFSKRFLTLLNTYHFETVAPDQDYINVMCNGKILYLNEEWNTMPTEGKEKLKNPKLIHYNLFHKPWCYDNVQYEEHFWNYAKKSGYYEQLVETKNNYSEEQKKIDSDCFKLLITNATNITQKEVNFKNIFDSGVDVRL